MSQYPGNPGGYPIDYNAGAFVPKPRPTSVTVIAVFAIVIGSLFLLCGAAALVGQVIMLGTNGQNPFLPSTLSGQAALVKPETAVTVYGVITGIVNLLIAAAMLAFGIGGIKLRPFARRGMIGLSVFIICWATLLTILQIAWVGPRTLEYSHRLQAQMPGPKPPAAFANIEQGAQWVGGVLMWVAWCALPVCVLIFWRSPRVVSAFEDQAIPPMGGMGANPMWPPAPGQPPGAY